MWVPYRLPAKNNTLSLIFSSKCTIKTHSGTGSGMGKQMPLGVENGSWPSFRQGACVGSGPCSCFSFKIKECFVIVILCYTNVFFVPLYRSLAHSVAQDILQLKSQQQAIPPFTPKLKMHSGLGEPSYFGS